MTNPPLACSVRDCGEPLQRHERTFDCPRRHTYDIARSGYINLLQPQDRRARAAGDTKAAVGARARLLAAGIGRAMIDEFVSSATLLAQVPRPVVVDLGSGTGETLATLASRRPISGVGIDLSAAAADHAARRFPSLTWVVANADRRLPLLPRSVDLVLSLHGRRNPAECARILRVTGLLLIGVPASDDLNELREALHGHAIDRARAATVESEHEALFTLLNRSSARERHRLERETLLDLLRGTYRGGRRREVRSVGALASLEVTLASDFLVFAQH